MAKKGKGILMTAFAAGLASYYSKKENRDKTLRLLKNMKAKTTATFSKETDAGEKEYAKKNNNDLKEIAETLADDTETKLRENNMIAESGLQTAVIYYNENNQEVR